MKVQYLLSFPQINAIHTLVGISGTISIAPDDVKLVEYDISEEQKSMLDSLLSQNGSIKEAMPWPSIGDEYFFISDYGCVKRDTNNGWLKDNARRTLGNMFKTKEEAEFELERLKVLNQLKSLSDDDQEWNTVNSHYHIIYDVRYHEFNVLPYSSIKLPQAYWFKSKESARAAIETIGEDKLKKYVFPV